MFAVIKTGGKQYLIKEGQTLNIEKLPKEKGQKVVFKEVLLLADQDASSVKLGNPGLEKVKVEAEILEQGKKDKVIIIKHKSKKRYKLKRGHRQPFSKIKVNKILV